MTFKKDVATKKNKKSSFFYAMQNNYFTSKFIFPFIINLKVIPLKMYLLVKHLYYALAYVFSFM